MTVIEHGDWQLYTPTTAPENAPTQALFARRVSDGIDWYDYVNAGSNFQTDSVKMTLADNFVCAAGTDPVQLFPSTGSVLEVTDVPLDDPQRDWGRKTYDPATQTFSDTPLPPNMPSLTPSADMMKTLLDRIAVLEAKAGGG